MTIENSPMTRLASFFFPWCSDLGTCSVKPNDGNTYTFSIKDRACFKDLQNYTDFESGHAVRALDIPNSVHIARYIKLAIAISGLIAAIILLVLGGTLSNSILFYTGVGVLTADAIWFLCLGIRNQTTGRGLPSFLPVIGGGRLRDAFTILKSDQTLRYQKQN